MDKMTIYNRLPIWGQNIACFLEGSRIAKTRYSKEFWSLLKNYEERKGWSYEHVCDYRDNRLKVMINHCYNTVPYYRKCFREYGINPESIKRMEDLKKLPILTKEIINSKPEQFISSKFKRNQLVKQHTSGTTGSGLVFYTTQKAICEQWAVWWRYRKNIGIRIDDWCAQFGGRSVVPVNQFTPPFYRWNKPCKQMYFSTYHMSEKNLEYYVEAIKKNGIKWIHGYPSAINLLSDYLVRSNQRISIDYITTGSENLLESQREKIIAAFGFCPYQHYGLSEGTANFSERPDHIMVIDEDFAAVEFVENQQGIKEIIGTNLTNFAMPFIRYNTGDCCEISELSNGRTISSLDGRKEDYLVLSNGTKIGRLDHIFKDIINVKEAQFVQKNTGAIELKVVKGPNYSEKDEGCIRREIQSRLGDVGIQIVYVENIARTKTGKFRFVIQD